MSDDLTRGICAGQCDPYRDPCCPAHDYRTSEPSPPDSAEVEYACNYCGITSWTDETLNRSRGRACPYCGEGVIQEVEP